MKNLVKLLFILSILEIGNNKVLLSQTSNHETKLSGAFGVSDGGSATYSLPINLPPGAGAMKPSLSLNYNSSAGNGLFGMGWALSGLSCITRGNKTIAQDSTSEKVQFNWDDVFYLDGERLVLLSNEIEYGRDGANYGTETNTFIKATSIGEGGHGPNSFQVKTKTGITMYFGSSPDSRVFVDVNNDTEVMMWLLDKMEDTNGNYIQFYYEKDLNNNSYRPISIVYTRNDNAGITTNFTEVEFDYESRDDIDYSYLNGVKTQITQRISFIRIKHKSVVKETYSFIYKEFGENKLSLLERIWHCMDDGKCADPITFNWETGSETLSFSTTNDVLPPAEFSGDKKEIYNYDISNDGLTDIILLDRQNNSIKFYLNNGNSSFTKINSNLTSVTQNTQLNFVDFSSDGFIDIIALNIEDGTNNWYYNKKDISIANGANFETTTNYISTTLVKDNRFLLLDYNGDARLDVLLVKNDGTYTLIKNYSGDTTITYEFHVLNVSLGLTQNQLMDNFIDVADFDNDGKTDLLLHNKNKNISGTNLWFRNTFTSVENNIYTYVDNNIINPDFFRLDAISISGNNSGYAHNDWVYNYKGDNIKIRNPHFGGIGYPKFMDINGDGLLDISFFVFHSDTWFNPEGTLGGNSQQKKLYSFINKGNFQFEASLQKTSNGGQRIYPCNLPDCSSTKCFLGYFYTDFGKSGNDWYNLNNVNSLDNDYFTDFADVNGDNKTDIITQDADGNVFIDTKFLAAGTVCTNTKRYVIGSDNYQVIPGRFSRFGTDILLYNKNNGRTTLFDNVSNPKPPVINAILGPIGGYIYITYGSLNDQSLYDRGNTRAYPEINYASSSEVVKEYRIVNYDKDPDYDSHTDVAHMTYKYFDGRLNLQGRGFRGFAKIEINDLIEGFRIVKEFEDNSRLIGASIKRGSTYTISGHLVSEEIYKNAQLEYQSDGSGGIYVPQYITFIQDKMFTPFPIESISRTYDLNGSLLSENKSKTSIDRFGNILYQTFEYGDGCIDSLVNDYANDFDTWYIGRLTSSRVFKNCPGEVEIIRESSFDYNSITGLLEKEILEPSGDETIKTVKTYEHDFWGNITKSTITAWNGTQSVSRSKTTKFDPTGRFQIETKNHLGHLVKVEFDDYRGLPIKVTDENGLITTLEYDSYGKNTKTIYPDGNYTDIYTILGYSFPESIQTFVNSSNEPASNLIMDQVGRERESYTKSFSGFNIKNGTHYQNNRAVYKEEPHDENNPFFEYINYGYDEAGRLNYTSETGNFFSLIENIINYNGLTQEMINPLGQVTKEIKDFQQRLLESIDNQGNSIHYRYDNQNQLKRIVVDDEGNYEIKYEYDLRGRLISMEDPVLGREEYTYDGFNNLLSKKDGKGNLITYTYDALNRIKSMIQSEGTAIYTYDQGNKAIGKLSKVEYTNYQKSFQYDNLGRIQRMLILINNSPYEYKFYYNAIGKIEKVDNPGGISLNYFYNDYNYLYKIDANANHIPVWEALEIDEKNRITHEVYGDGIQTYYQYDNQENLASITTVNKNDSITQSLFFDFNALNLKVSKSDYINNIFEQYEYDDLNRLINVFTSGVIQDTLSMTYDKWGNLLSKSDLGIYHYNENNPTILDRVEFFNPDCSLPSALYNYEYTSFNKIKAISNDSIRLELFYGPDNERIGQNIYHKNILTESRIYVGSDYEIISINGQETKRITLASPSGSIGVFEKKGNQAGTFSYFIKDDQHTMTSLTDESGNVRYSFVFDVWGNRKLVTYQDSLLGLSYRGYTGHEHISIFNLVNMNGRVYDPVLARFLTADPFISDQANFQSYNRYSYVHNSPNNLVDPSGYLHIHIGGTIGKWAHSASKTIQGIGNGIKSIANGHIRDGFSSLGQAYIDVYFKWTGQKELYNRGAKVFGQETWNQIVVAAATITVAYCTAGVGAGFTGAIMSGMASGFTGGALSTAIAGGGTNDILKAGFKGAAIGGVSAGLTYGVGSGAQALKDAGANTFAVEGLRAIGHAVVQGGVNEMQGGTFSQGFISGFVSSLGSHTQGLYGNNNAVRVFAASMVGGTLSSITGGKFATGAVSGAFVEMFNRQQHPDEIDDATDEFKGEAESALAKAIRKVIPDGFGSAAGGVLKSINAIGGAVDFLRGEGIYFGKLDANDVLWRYNPANKEFIYVGPKEYMSRK